MSFMKDLPTLANLITSNKGVSQKLSKNNTGITPLKKKGRVRNVPLGLLRRHMYSKAAIL